MSRRVVILLSLLTLLVGAFVYYVYFQLNVSFYYMRTILTVIATGSATIFAFVLSVTLIASQVSQSYSLGHVPKVVPKTVTVLYSLSLIIGGIMIPLVVLSDTTIVLSIEIILIKFSIVMISLNAIFLLIYLYLFRTWLTPKNIINDLFKMSKHKLQLKKAEEEREDRTNLPSEVYQVREIALRSAELDNYEGFNNGMRKIKDVLRFILSPQSGLKLEQKQKTTLSYDINRIFEEVAVKLRTDQATDQIALDRLLPKFLEAWRVTAEYRPEDNHLQVMWGRGVRSIIDGAIKTDEERLVNHYQYILWQYTLKVTKERKALTVKRTVEILRVIQINADQKNWKLVLRNTATHFSEILKKIIIEAPKEGETKVQFDNICDGIIGHLSKKGERSLSKGFYKKANSYFHAMTPITTLLKQEYVGRIKEVIDSWIRYVKLAESDYTKGAKSVVNRISETGENASEELSPISVYSIEQLFDLALILTQNKALLMRITGSINYIGIAGIKNSKQKILEKSTDKLSALVNYMNIIGHNGLANLASAQLFQQGGLAHDNSMVVKDIIEIHNEIKESYGKEFLKKSFDKAGEWNSGNLSAYWQKVMQYNKSA